MNPTLSAKEERQNHILHGKKKLKKLLFSFKEITCDLRYNKYLLIDFFTNIVDATDHQIIDYY